MKTKLILLILACSILLLAACTTKTEKPNNTTIPTDIKSTVSQPTQQQVVKIKWEFINYTKKDSVNGDIEYPYTDVYLDIDSIKEKKELIGSYMGSAIEIKDFKNYDFPINSILACQSYYAGGGDDICVVRDGDEILVKWRIFNEPEGDEELVKPEFKVLKKIQLPKMSKVEVPNLTDIVD